MIPINVVCCFISELVDKADWWQDSTLKSEPMYVKISEHHPIRRGQTAKSTHPGGDWIQFAVCEIDFRLICHRERRQKLKAEAAQLRPGKIASNIGGSKGGTVGWLVGCLLGALHGHVPMAMARARATSRLGADSASAQRSRSNRWHTRLPVAGFWSLGSLFSALSLAKWP